eukprot:scaffold32022_cov62-Phaeocystis_antarctica.AAC.9
MSTAYLAASPASDASRSAAREPVIAKVGGLDGSPARRRMRQLPRSSCTAGSALGASGSGPSSHRSGGTSLTVSAPPAATRHAEPAESAPPGSTALAPTSTTCPLAAMGARCGLLVGGDEARSEVRPANRTSLGDAAAADAAAGAATGARWGSRRPASRAAPPRRRRPAAAPAGCAAPPRPASRAPPPSAARPRPHPRRSPRRPLRAPHHDQPAHWPKARASQDPTPRLGASPSAA